MSLKSFTVLILLLAAVSPAWATTARITALGGGDFLEDDHNVLRWYGSLVDYPDQVVLESGHFNLPDGWHDVQGRLTSGPALGAHLKLGTHRRWGTLAVFANAQGHDVDPGGLAANRMPTTGTALWSRRFGKLAPTLILQHSHDTGHRTAPPDFSWDRTRTEYGLGVRWDVSAGAYLDLAGELRHHAEQTSTTTNGHRIDGDRRTSNASIGLRSRLFVRLNPTLAFVPVVTYLHEDRPLSAPAPDVATDLSGELWTLGTGLNWYPDPDHLLVVSLDYLHAHSNLLVGPAGAVLDVQNARRWHALSLTVGFESRFRYWLSVRGSLRYEPVSLTDTVISAPADFAALGINLGAALHLGPYDLDLALSDREPQAVPGAYGHTQNAPTTSWLTATFRRTF